MSLPAPPPAFLPIAVLMAVVVPVPVPVPVSSSSSSSSLSSYKLSVTGLQPDSPPGLSQPLPSPSLPAFSAAHRALQAACRV